MTFSDFNFLLIEDKLSRFKINSVQLALQLKSTIQNGENEKLSKDITKLTVHISLHIVKTTEKTPMFLCRYAIATTRKQKSCLPFE